MLGLDLYQPVSCVWSRLLLCFRMYRVRTAILLIYRLVSSYVIYLAVSWCVADTYIGNFGFLPFVLELHSLIKQGTEFET